MPRAGRRKVIGEYCRARLKEECDGVFGRQAQIARMTGFAPPHLTSIRQGNRNVGYDLASALAEKVWGMTLSELESAAVEWSKGRNVTPDTETAVELDARYPNLAEAIAYREDKWLDVTAETLSKIAAHYPEDKSFGDWVDEGDDLDKAFRRKLKGGQPFEPGGDEDDTPPRGRG